MDFQTNEKLQMAFDFVQYTGQNIFLTGKAGTGKTTFLRKLKELSPKRMMVVAPTGVAAINAGGVTIHSFFQLSFAPQVENIVLEQEKHKFSKSKIDIIRSLDLLVIDEISMVRADVLDVIDNVLRRYRRTRKPFGGVQLLMIGDLQQLAPVVKDEEMEVLQSVYDTIFFFGSKALKSTSYVGIELTHVFRQQDERFINLLNKVRENKMDAPSLDLLNSRYVPNFRPSKDDGFITLCTHNYQAQKINERELFLIDKDIHRFTAVVEGKFPEYAYPTDFELIFKEGAQVMFVKNDTSRDKLFYNGKIGKIESFNGKIINVRCPGDMTAIPVSPLKWENEKYTINKETKEIKEEVEGTFTQYPLKLAWAITIHKSQGLTFEHAIIDAEDAFAHGQVYVALSRCKTLEGMVLSRMLTPKSIITDMVVDNFTNSLECAQPDSAQLKLFEISYQQEILAEVFGFKPLFSAISNVAAVARANRSAFSESTVTALGDIQGRMSVDVISVADKFFAQIAQLLQEQADISQNVSLLERIPKAANYFIDKLLSDFEQPLSKLDLEIDNKAIQDQLDRALTHLREELKVKSVMLEVCLHGFSVSQVMSARAKAQVDMSAAPKKKIDQSPNFATNIDVPHPELYAFLRQWRMQKSEEGEVPPYMVFSQKALLDLVTMLPLDLSSLETVNGFGSKKVKQYGREIIEIINDYCLKNHIEGAKATLSFDVPASKPSKEPKGKSSSSSQGKTFLATLSLYQQGFDLDGIVKERGLSMTTIENHLIYWISKGKIAPSDFIKDDKLNQIIDFFKTNNTRSLSAARESLGDSSSYFELKIGLHYLDFLASDSL